MRLHFSFIVKIDVTLTLMTLGWWRGWNGVLLRNFIRLSGAQPYSSRIYP